MNPSLPPQLSQRSSERWAAERSVAHDRPSCSFEITRTRSRRSTLGSQGATVPPPQTIAVDHLDLSPRNPETQQFEEAQTDLLPASRLIATSNSSATNSPTTNSSTSNSSTSNSSIASSSFPAVTSLEAPKTSLPALSSALATSPATPHADPSQMEIVTQRSLPAPIPAPAPPVPSTRVVPQSVAQSVSPRSGPHYSSAHKTTITVQPFSVQQDVFKEPSLPRLKQVQLNPHRHSHNPLFPLSLLQDIAAIVEDWQAQLESLHEQVQAIYLDGPIVDGWLEAEATLDGVIQGYRLCGLDEQGQMWARPCPPDQLPGVSTAIARYQHLRQLLAQKQALEMRFQQLGETLAMVRSSL